MEAVLHCGTLGLLRIRSGCEAGGRSVWRRRGQGTPYDRERTRTRLVPLVSTDHQPHHEDYCQDDDEPNHEDGP
jgi:hypothetical protein